MPVLLHHTVRLGVAVVSAERTVALLLCLLTRQETTYVDWEWIRMEMQGSWELQVEGKAGEDKRRGLMTERLEILSKLEKS